MRGKKFTFTTTEAILDEVKCPKCGVNIPLSETLYAKVADDAQREAKLKFEQSREKLEKDILERVENEKKIELLDLKKQNEEKEKKLEESRKRELDFIAEKRALEESKKDLELEVARKLEAERKALFDKATQKVLEEHALADAQKDKQLADTRNQLEVLQRKMDQSSQQAKGENLETELEDLLLETFRSDDITPIEKGINGADILHKVHAASGNCCGIIIWETKNTKTWSNKWVSKLKEDQRQYKADCAVLVTTTLPKEIKSFDYKNGVLITNFALAPSLALIIRDGIIQQNAIKNANIGKNEKLEGLFTYITGPQFKHRIEAIGEAWQEMRAEIDEERRVFAKKWAQREKQLEKMANSVAGMYGDMKGIAGPTMQKIALLEFKKKE